MTQEYKNYLGEELAKDKVFVSKITKAIKKLYAQNKETLFEGDNISGKLFESDKGYYLIVYKDNLYNVYSEKKSKWKETPFNYEITKLMEDRNSKIYTNKVATVLEDASKEHEPNKKIEDMLKIYDAENYSPERLQRLREMFIDSMGIVEQKPDFSASAFEIRTFLKYLEKSGVTPVFSQDRLEKNPTLYEKVNGRVEELGLIAKLLVVVTKEHGFNSKNQLDSYSMTIWKQGRYVVVKDQNITFALDYKNTENFDIYAASHEGEFKNTKSLNQLVINIRENPDDLVGNMALSVKKGQTVYADNNTIAILDNDFVRAKDYIEEEELGQVQYPVDVKDFDYQFAYTNQRYGYSKLEFIVHALFVLGNGFTYDSEKGRLYSDVVYDAKIMKDFKEPVEKETPFESMVYLWPKDGLKKLDEKWNNALEYVVKKIKADNPDLTKTCVPTDMTPNDVMRSLEEIITYNKKSQFKLK
jgi:hypothetical protein